MPSLGMGQHTKKARDLNTARSPSSPAYTQMTKEKSVFKDYNTTDSSTDEKGYIKDKSEGPIQKWLADWKPVAVAEVDPTLSRQERAIFGTAEIPFKHALKNRHIQMIAIGGSLGAGLFVGTGNSLKAGGPGGLVIGYSIIGILLFSTMTALGELGVRYPSAGVFSAYNSRFIHMSWGFAIGWNYVLGWLVSLPTELIAAANTITYWKLNGDDNGAVNVNRAAWVGFFYGVIMFINVFGVRGYGEAEFVMSTIKVITIIGFIIFGIVATCGGTPAHHYFGAHYWHDPGSFPNGAKGVFKVFVTASYAFSGCEFAGLAAMESGSPHKTLPRAAKQVFWRILLFYIVSIVVMCCLVPANNPQLGTDSTGNSSPFVLAIKAAGVKGLPSVINVVIILAVLSVGNAAIYGSSRTIISLAAQGHAPRFLLYIDRQGRPVYALIIAFVWGLIGFVCATPTYSKGFTWLSSIGGLSSLLTWGSICVCHIRHRLGMRAQNIPTSELEYKAPLGVWGSVMGTALTLAVLGLNFWVSLFPLGSHGKASAQGFFQTWLSACIIVAFFIPHVLWYRDPLLSNKNLDVTSAVRVSDRDQLRAEIAEEKAYISSKGWWYRAYRFWC